ncbi:type II toxin-antitoxin system RelE family toxin [Adlercreutzia shanghongiae]|uniref:Type II toxin-antitoxin system RelE/ParE family toxin n=1 Tax=Adlercreutzia shanghongiae TaxID=3111773 RepID=A0ABU6IWA6_9ACTN|nr:type II toxin-antitoxin system RelE/ParE family toxin [Adlercreutzia sp. R22]MEC4293844.1 type II toxin-antitoxin system RelE/ParE family toxin [Adlercreutzia sp. R22]
MWRLLFSKKADKQLSKLDPGVRRVLLSWLLKHLDGCEGPRALGKGLSGDKAGIWRYRVGDYRILCDIKDDELVVLALEIGHRRDVYR